MTELTRRSFFQGVGALSVTLLFKKTLDNVLDSLEADLTTEQPANPMQLPTAADVVVTPQLGFRAERVIVAKQISRLFVIENIIVGNRHQALFEVPACVVGDVIMEPTGPTSPLKFRVRYVGDSKDGAQFRGVIFGRTQSLSMIMLPIESIRLGA